MYDTRVEFEHEGGLCVWEIEMWWLCTQLLHWKELFASCLLKNPVGKYGYLKTMIRNGILFLTDCTEKALLMILAATKADWADPGQGRGGGPELRTDTLGRAGGRKPWCAEWAGENPGPAGLREPWELPLWWTAAHFSKTEGQSICLVSTPVCYKK